MTPKGRSAQLLASACMFVLQTACGTGLETRTVSLPQTGTEISVERALRAGARTPWDALRLAGHHDTLLQSSAGDGVNTRGRRGSTAPIVVVDGARTTGTHWLHELHLSTVERITVLSGVEATTRYGAGAAGGAILIVTRR